MRIHSNHTNLTKLVVDELLEIEYNFRSNFIRYFLTIPSISEDELELLDMLEFCFDFSSKSFSICNQKSEGAIVLYKYLPSEMCLKTLNIGQTCKVKDITSSNSDSAPIEWGANSA